jgi:phosphoesterase RecJ-like protein
MNFKEFLSALDTSQNIAITAPAGADGDSVGTQCALAEILRILNPKKKIRILNEEPCPRRYRFLSLSSDFEVSSTVLKSSKEEWPDTLICVDGGVSRIGKDTTEIWKKAKKWGQVDHHALGGENPYHFRLYDPQAASTTEIIFKLLKDQNLALTKTMAEAIYVGLIFDTGMFKHSNTRPETLQIAAELMKTGFSHTEVAEKAMLIRTPGAFSLLKTLLAKSTFDLGGRYVWSSLSYEDFKNSGGDSDDKEGLIDQLFLTDKCEIAAFYFEKNPNEWKVSFRARGWDVANLARSLNAQGGGHKLAAGCTLMGHQTEILKSCHEAVAKLLGKK